MPYSSNPDDYRGVVGIDPSATAEWEDQQDRQAAENAAAAAESSQWWLEPEVSTREYYDK